MTELKPCPFCVSKNIVDHGEKNTWINCINCGAEGPLRGDDLWETKADAIEAWNRRASDDRYVL